MIQSKIARAVHLAVSITTVASVSFVAHAQDQSQKDEAKFERVEVTGSRIARHEFAQPAPILTLTGEQIEQAGIPDLASVLAELPAIGATATIRANSNDNGAAGVSNVDLRRLGEARTLVLVNGKRHVAGSAGSSSVDLSTIPSALIERVDVITGGASAIYGSDAVSGVVNVILKKDFEGLEFKASYSNSTEGVGNSNKTFSLLTGASTSDGKGNVTLFVSQDTIDEVMARDMPNFNTDGLVPNPANTGENDGIVDRIWVKNVTSERISPNSVLLAGPYNYTFSNNGVGELMPNRDLTQGFAFGSFPDGCKYCFNPDDYENYLPQREKVTVASTFNYEISDEVNLYGDVKYVRSDIMQQFQPSFRFNENRVVIADNPFIPQATKEFFADKGIESAFVNKFFDEIGNRSADNKRETFRIVAGAKGTFELSQTAIDYDVYYSNGRTENSRLTLNDLIVGNYAAALDAVVDPATGKAACRANVPSAQPEGYKNPATVDRESCVPYNPFGYGLASQEAMDWVTADVQRDDTIKQRYIGGSLSLDSGEFFELPGGAVGFAFGYEKRWESSETITDELTRSGAMANAATPNTYGEYDVSEFFVETSLPLLADTFLAHELNLDAAYRKADYSHAGEVDSWKVGFMWTPVEGYSLRGTYGEAVRAPNIAEAFDPRSPGFGRVDDPCSVDRVNDEPTRAANCAALGIPANFKPDDAASKRVISGGNPNLSVESSESLTLGLVMTPIENLTFSIDYYDIEIVDAIKSLTAQTVANNCVDGPVLDPVFCGQVTRDPSTLAITTVESGELNTAKLELKGIDFDMKYTLDLANFDLPGLARFGLFVSHTIELNKYEFQNRPEVVTREHGELGDPELQANFNVTYRLDDIAVSWGTRFIDRSAMIDLEDTYTADGVKRGDIEEDREFPYIGSFVTHDLSAKYYFDKATLEIGFRNIFDKQLPDFVTGRGEDSALYDPWGRRAFANLTYRF
ncbi:TonB-dependent receptor domain-containing protein [Pseudoalteromonas fenneropenaei]|uniref:TonB-dependent receptor domain-containing protein n=1 Tax=Pseudoalteromonas fenneropenaei TaxID=1737459 RepID=A0ABV7CDZ4_9GAMM